MEPSVVLVHVFHSTDQILGVGTHHLATVGTVICHFLDLENVGDDPWVQTQTVADVLVFFDVLNLVVAFAVNSVAEGGSGDGAVHLNWSVSAVGHGPVNWVNAVVTGAACVAIELLDLVEIHEAECEKYDFAFEICEKDAADLMGFGSFVDSGAVVVVAREVIIAEDVFAAAGCVGKICEAVQSWTLLIGLDLLGDSTVNANCGME